MLLIFGKFQNVNVKKNANSKVNRKFINGKCHRILEQLRMENWSVEFRLAPLEPTPAVSWTSVGRVHSRRAPTVFLFCCLPFSKYRSRWLTSPGPNSRPGRKRYPNRLTTIPRVWFETLFPKVLRHFFCLVVSKYTFAINHSSLAYTF